MSILTLSVALLIVVLLKRSIHLLYFAADVSGDFALLGNFSAPLPTFFVSPVFHWSLSLVVTVTVCVCVCVAAGCNPR